MERAIRWVRASTQAKRFRADPSNAVLLDSGGLANFSVGGTLTVHPNMAPGVYTGTLTVSVAYN